MGRGVAEETILAELEPVDTLDAIGQRGDVGVGGEHAVNLGVTDGAEITKLSHVDFDVVGRAGADECIQIAARGVKPGGQVVIRVEHGIGVRAVVDV